MAKVHNGRISMKRIGVDKTNARIVASAAVAAFLVLFFLVGSFSLLGTLRYQNRIIQAKKQAVSQLKKNMTARDSLVASYKNFAGTDQNFLGGTATGSGAQDGNNAKLVLDALPGTYDFPALVTSLEKLAQDQQLTITGITGTDDSVAQSAAGDSPTAQPVAMPFELKATGTYDNVQKLVNAFDRSIRPIQMQKLQLTGDTNGVVVDATATTYYQPEKALTIKTKVVK